jgi:hypothetical protein
VLSVVLAGLLTLSSVTAGIGRTPAVTASGTLNCRDPIGTEDRLPANSKVAGRAVALLTGMRVDNAQQAGHREKQGELRGRSHALPTNWVHARLDATGTRRRCGELQ